MAARPWLSKTVAESLERSFRTDAKIMKPVLTDACVLSMCCDALFGHACAWMYLGMLRH